VEGTTNGSFEGILSNGVPSISIEAARRVLIGYGTSYGTTM
jgi:hypothetical protein